MQKRERLIGLSVRAALWAALVFVAIPMLIGAYPPRGPVLELNNNVASLFVAALLVTFGIWHRERLLAHPLGWQRSDGILFGISSAAIYWLSWQVWHSYVLGGTLLMKVMFIIIPPLLFACASALLAVAIFGKAVMIRERRALFVGFIVGVPYVALSLLIRLWWDYLSFAVVKANAFLLPLTGGLVTVTYGGAPLLALNNFAVTIGEACSGVDSAIMFSGVFLFIGLLDWKRLDGNKFIPLLPIGLAGMFAVNILRIALLMIVGAYISPDLALNLFHVNAGWVLFVAYTLGFWYIAYPKVLLHS